MGEGWITIDIFINIAVFVIIIIIINVIIFVIIVFVIIFFLLKLYIRHSHALQNTPRTVQMITFVSVLRQSLVGSLDKGQ